MGMDHEQSQRHGGGYSQARGNQSGTSYNEIVD